MIPNPILRVLSTIQRHKVKALLMGGQACVLYGAAEFSRDTDLVVLAEPENLQALDGVLQELQARRIAVPEFTMEHLARGHAVHFRCLHAEVAGLRIDIMSKLRGVAPFDELWSRRATVPDLEGGQIAVLSLADLVKAKKTQRSKDWPMIQRLVESDYFKHRLRPTSEQVEFWFRELRSPELLVELAGRHVELCASLSRVRPLLSKAAPENIGELDESLMLEERQERERDRLYWQPLKKELEAMRHGGHAEGSILPEPE